MIPALTFAITIFLSAFLLFLVQPLISRYILPWFGGTPAVWSVSLLFFQSLLLVGYAYAHKISIPSRRKLVLHAVLLAVSILVIIISIFAWGVPLLPDAFWRPPDASLPILRIVTVLLISVGLPYFVLSTTSPLLQSWFHILEPDRSPYRLYALSNLGSFLALALYPFLFEPLLDLPKQSVFFTIAYMVYIGLCFFLLMKVFKYNLTSQLAEPFGETGSPNTDDAEKEETIDSSGKNPSYRNKKEKTPFYPRKLMWILLPAITSILLMAVTNQLTQEVAVIPFLWVLPLAIYLLSFTITFADNNWYRPGITVILLAISSLLICYALNNLTHIGVFSQILIFCFFLLFATILLHGELYRLRPHSQELTSFYLMVSLGGVVGGLFVNLAAPVIFNGFWELQVGILICWLMVLVLLLGNRNSPIYQGENKMIIQMWLLVMGIIAILSYESYNSTQVGVILVKRNFYGVFRVRQVAFGEDELETRMLSHGITTHGFQFTDPERRDQPTAYYGPGSGIGLTISNINQVLSNPSDRSGLKVGVVGLGVGTLAAYGQSGDTFRFYEINPDIIDLAKGGGGIFSFLSDSPANIEIVKGDARIQLEAELAKGKPQMFDVLAVDAFSSDSIPVHLLTREAIGLYLQHLQPDGVLAMHISNRYLNLAPILEEFAREFDLGLAYIRSPRTDSGSYTAVWVLLTKNQAFLDLPEITNADQDIPDPIENVRIWTDAYSNIMPYLRMQGVFSLK
jgi:hypothetical protein